MLKYINFIFLFLTLLIITCILHWLNLYPQQNNINNINNYRFTEKFNNYSNNLIIDAHNKLLQNSSSNLKETMMHNPGLTSKVLEITNNNNKYTQISNITVENIVGHSKYRFGFWFAYKNGINLNNDSIIRLFTFHANTVNDHHNPLKLNIMKATDNKLNQNELNQSFIKNIEWLHVNYLIEIPINLQHNKLDINISTNSNIKANKIYLAGLYLTRFLPNSPDFIMTKDLKILIDVNSVKPNSYILKDQSNSGNDIKTISGDKLNYNIIDNKFSLYNNNYESTETAAKILGTFIDELTICMYISISQQGVYNNFIKIPGNQGNTLSISIDNSNIIEEESICGNGFIKVVLNDSTTLITKGALVLSNTLITITYSKKNNELIIYYEDTKIASLNVKLNLLPSSSEKISINLINNTVGHPNLIGLAIYTSSISNKNDLTTLSTYFQNQRRLNRPSVAPHILSNTLDNITDKYNIDNSFKKNNEDLSFIYIDNNDPIKLDSDYYNNNYLNSDDDIELAHQSKHSHYHKLRKRCKNAIKQKCDDIDNEKHYNKCVRKVDMNNSDCLAYCNKNSHKDKNLCKIDNNKCPYVYIKNHSYFVHIPKTCKYYKYLNKDDIDYGKNRYKAMRLFENNFSDCDIPDILKYPDGEHPSKNCPFKLHDNNPCKDRSCNNVNWKHPIYEQPVCQECKYSIAHYCKKNADIDDSCICWSDEFKDLGECKAFRKFYDNPNDYQCSIDKFNIEDHPNFNKYIKKNNIPCWNCNLETSNTNYKPIGNR